MVSDVGIGNVLDHGSFELVLATNRQGGRVFLWNGSIGWEIGCSRGVDFRYFCLAGVNSS